MKQQSGWAQGEAQRESAQPGGSPAIGEAGLGTRDSVFTGVSKEGMGEAKAVSRKGASGSCVQTALTMEDGSVGGEKGTRC